jgi:hypothetical protein
MAADSQAFEVGRSESGRVSLSTFLDREGEEVHNRIELRATKD